MAVGLAQLRSPEVLPMLAQQRTFFAPGVFTVAISGFGNWLMLHSGFLRPRDKG